MISEIRSYFKSIIKQVDSDLKEYKVPTPVDLPSNPSDCLYQIVIGNSTNTVIDNSYQSTFSVDVLLYEKAKRDDLIAVYDKFYCKGIDIQAMAMAKNLIAQNATIKALTSNSININALATNESVYAITINFEVTTFYKLQGE